MINYKRLIDKGLEFAPQIGLAAGALLGAASIGLVGLFLGALGGLVVGVTIKKCMRELNPQS